MLLGIGVGSVHLAVEDRFYQLLVILQLLAYAGALAGRAAPSLRRLFPIRILSAFFDMNLYAVLGTFDFLRQRNAHLWQTTSAIDANVVSR